MRPGLFVCLLFLAFQGFSQSIVHVASGQKTSIRGLSVVDNKIVWASGSNGWTAHSIDGGKNWKWIQLAGYEKLDFRDIEAFSATRAVVVSAGSPAVILITDNGGITWKEPIVIVLPTFFWMGWIFGIPRMG